MWNENIASICAAEAWIVYGARFRGRGRQAVRDAIQRVPNWPCASQAMSSSPRWRWEGGGHERRLFIGTASLAAPLPTLEDYIRRAARDSSTLTTAVVSAACGMHVAAVDHLLAADTISKHGIVDVAADWLWHWLRVLAKASVQNIPTAMCVGCGMYLRRLPTESSRCACWWCTRACFVACTLTGSFHVRQICFTIRFGINPRHPTLCAGGHDASTC